MPSSRWLTDASVSPSRSGTTTTGRWPASATCSATATAATPSRRCTPPPRPARLPTPPATTPHAHGRCTPAARHCSTPTPTARLLDQAIEAARRVGRDFVEGVALVSLASLYGRHGDTDRAVALFRETVAHWRRLGDYTHQLTTLRNLVHLLARIGVDDAAAVLHGAVTVGSTPSFGAEAERLTAAWEHARKRLGTSVAEAAAARGRHLPLTEVVDEALAALDALTGEATSAGRPVEP